MSRSPASVRSAVILVSALLLGFGSGTAAWAQAPSGSAPAADKSKWEIDVHAGGVFGNQPTAGTAIDAFPVGDPFTAAGTGRPGRYASTWYFGDGAANLNQIATAFLIIPVTTRITPLDPVLTKASLERQRGPNLGVRLTRRLSPRVGVEFGVDSFTGKLNLTDAALKGVEATRAGFAPMWDAIIATGGGVLFTNGNTSSTTTLVDGTHSRQTSVTGAVNVALSKGTRLTPYVTVGGGARMRSGDLPTATLTGNYQFRFGGLSPLNESDVVKVHYTAKDNVPVGLFGGGVKYALSPRQGVRADVRVSFSSNSLDTLVDAHPGGVPGTPAFVINSGTTPTLVFSNTSAVRGNLTGPAIVDLKTFTGSGLDVQTHLTVGYFVRF